MSPSQLMKSNKTNASELLHILINDIKPGYVHMCTYVCILICVHIHMDIHTNLCDNVNVYAYVYVCICMFYVWDLLIYMLY